MIRRGRSAQVDAALHGCARHGLRLLMARQELMQRTQHGAFARMMDVINRRQQRLDELRFRLERAERQAIERCRRRCQGCRRCANGSIQEVSPVHDTSSVSSSSFEKRCLGRNTIHYASELWKEVLHGYSPANRCEPA